MNAEELQSGAAFASHSDQLVYQGAMENPLWRGDPTPIDHVDNSAQHGVTGSAEYSSGPHDACFYPQEVAGDGQLRPRLPCVEAPNAAQRMMMNNPMGLPRPPCPSYPVMGYFPGPPRAPTAAILPDIDLSHRPGSLQEAICMYIDYLMAENELRTRISECVPTTPPPPLDFHREDYYRDVMCRPVNFPTARFRDWLKRYNVDIEITDPDGQTVSQTTFAPAPVTQSTAVETPEAGPPPPPPAPAMVDQSGEWEYVEPEPPRHGQRAAAQRAAVICHAGGAGSTPTPVDLAPPSSSSVGQDQFLQLEGHNVQGVTCPELLTSASDGPPLVDETSAFPDQSTLTQHVEYQDPKAENATAQSFEVLPTETKEEPSYPDSGMPVSGWPTIMLDQPESARTHGSMDTLTYVEADQEPAAMRSSSADAYFVESDQGGTDVSRYDPRCFAAADHQWGSPSNPAHFPQISLPSHASTLPLDMRHGTASFPVIIEPAFPSDSDDGAPRIPMTQELADCFNSMSEGVETRDYQLAYDDPGPGQDLYPDSEGPVEAPLGGPVAASTPPSQATASCLDLGEDFADLLGSRTSHEFDYQLTYGSTLTSDLAVPDQLPSESAGERRAKYRCRTKPQTASFYADDGGRPACKFARKDD